ncbi:MAG: hypothetical protein KAY37_04665, partial [Phycisphaerae bacterium]|nr:hypothetical protein [Phycisphaerae bacterium]
AVSAVSMGGTAVSAVYKSQVFTADTAVPPIALCVPLLLSSVFLGQQWPWHCSRAVLDIVECTGIVKKHCSRAVAHQPIN